MLADLAFGLARMGAVVSVITSRLRYDAQAARLPAGERINGVDVLRVWTTGYGRSILLLRALDYLTFYLASAWALLVAARRGDVVVAMTDPPMLSVVVLPIARLRGAKVVNWLQDIFPEVAEALGVGGPLGKAAYRALRSVRDASLRSADANVAIGGLMSQLLIKHGLNPSKLHLIPNWADCETVLPIEAASNPLRAQWGLNGSFVVGYSGNLGRAHEIATMLDAISGIETAQRLVPAATSIRWLFIGGGAMLEAMRLQAQQRGLQSVEFRAYQPRERLAESLSVADVHLVSLRPELEGLIVPSKYYGIAAAGRPAITIGREDGELARLVVENGCGLAIGMGDSIGLMASILKLSEDKAGVAEMGRKARALCELQFDKSVAMAKWAAVIHNL